jgi:hypothetical protein
MPEARPVPVRLFHPGSVRASAAAALMACASLCILLMEERPLAGPATLAEMAE